MAELTDDLMLGRERFGDGDGLACELLAALSRRHETVERIAWRHGGCVQRFDRFAEAVPFAALDIPDPGEASSARVNDNERRDAKNVGLMCRVGGTG